MQHLARQNHVLGVSYSTPLVKPSEQIWRNKKSSDQYGSCGCEENSAWQKTQTRYGLQSGKKRKKKTSTTFKGNGLENGNTLLQVFANELQHRDGTHIRKVPEYLWIFTACQGFKGYICKSTEVPLPLHCWNAEGTSAVDISRNRVRPKQIIFKSFSEIQSTQPNSTIPTGLLIFTR